MIRVNFWENGALRAPVAQFPKDPLNNAPLNLEKTGALRAPDLQFVPKCPKSGFRKMSNSRILGFWKRCCPFPFPPGNNN